MRGATAAALGRTLGLAWLAAVALLLRGVTVAVEANRIHDAIMNLNANAKSVGPLKQAVSTEGVDGLNEKGPGGQTPLSESSRGERRLAWWSN